MTTTTQSVLLEAFPQYLEEDVLCVYDMILRKNKRKIINSVHQCHDICFIDNSCLSKKIRIPARVYFDEVNESSFNDTQKQILYCIYSRHHNGFMRQEYLTKIGEVSELWQVPFILQLLGEYVMQLFPIIDKKINAITLPLFIRFISENPVYFIKTEARVMSYWNEYYRSLYPNKKNYLGYKIIHRLKKEIKAR